MGTQARRNAIAAITFVTLAGGLSACSDDASESAPAAVDRSWAEDHTPQEIATAAFRSQKSLSSFHIDASAPQDGAKIVVSLSVADARNCFGTIKLGDTRPSDLVIVKGVDYLRTTAAGWAALAQQGDPSISDEQAETTGRLLDGKWVHSGESSDVCKSFTGDITESGSVPMADRKTGYEDVEGEPAVKVQVTDPDHPKQKGTFWVQIAAPHHLLRARLGQPAGFIDLTLSEIDEPVDVPSPPKKDRLDTTKLAG